MNTEQTSKNIFMYKNNKVLCIHGMYVCMNVYVSITEDMQGLPKDNRQKFFQKYTMTVMDVICF